MTGAQRVIKYMAIAFAIFLIVNICSAIIFGLSIIAGIFDLNTKELPAEGKITKMEDIIEVRTLDIEIKYAKFNIKCGDEFKLESNDSNIYFRENKDAIQVLDDNNGWLNINDNKEVTLYIPEDIIFDEIKINTGAGKVEIELLQAQNLDLKVGAGVTKIRELNIMENAKIKGGAGKFEIDSGIINNLELNVGVGKTEIKSEISGNSTIEAGIGKLDIHLIGNDYQIETENGLGTIRINGDKVENEYKYGKGDNILKIKGGVGGIDIDFEE